MPTCTPPQKNVMPVRCLFFILGILLFAMGVSHALAREVRVGIYENFPKVFTDSNGTPAGVFVDVIEDIAKREDWTLQYVHGSWQECIENLESGTIDILPDVAYSPERAESYDFCEESILSNWAQVYTRSGVTVDIITDMEGLRVSTLRGGIHHEEFKYLAKNFGFSYKMTLVDDYREVFRLLHEGQIDAGIVNRIFGFAHEEEFDVVRTHMMFSPTSLRFVVRKGSNADIISAIDRHLAAMKADMTSVYHQSLNRWLGVTSKLTLPPSIARTLIAAGIGLLLLFVMSVLLKYQVNRKTAHLRSANAKLEEQVSKTTKAEGAMRESERKWRSLVENFHDIVFIIDYSGKMAYANPAMTEQTGFTASDFQSPGLNKLCFHPDDKETVGKFISDFASSSEQYSEVVECRFIDRWDQTHWCSSVMSKVEYEGEPCLQFISHDMTARKLAEIALQEALAEVRKLKGRLQEENVYLKEEIREVHNSDEIVGQSKALKGVLEKVEQVAATDAIVLIQGETGTGKELVARAVHERSLRRDRPMIKVNCASIPKELFESEFFGHVKGAFTGALKDRTGRFQLADGGTLFLDEVGEIPLELQGKLLRVLQEGQFERIGDDATRSVDVRVISSTNRHLEEEVLQKQFRQDLFFRLSVFPIEVPPLRDRLDDVHLLARHFLEKFCRRVGIPDMRLEERHINLLQQYSWPGNVRELENVIERAVVTSDDGELNVTLPEVAGRTPLPSVTPDAGSIPNQRQVLTQDQVEKMEIENTVNALKKTNWKVYGSGSASELLGIKPSTLASRIKAWGLKRGE